MAMRDDDLELVSGGNRYSGEQMKSCLGCGIMTPVSKLVDGKCNSCNTTTGVQVGTPKPGTIDAVKRGKNSGGIMMC